MIKKEGSPTQRSKKNMIQFGKGFVWGSGERFFENSRS